MEDFVVWKRLLPDRFDNRYLGQAPGLWLFYPLTAINVGIDCVAVFRADGGAQSADGIPLNSFGPAAASTVIGIVAFLGLAGLLLGILYVLAAFRYRAMVPLMYVLMVTEIVGHKMIRVFKPITYTGVSAGDYVSLTILALSVIGCCLAVTGKGYASLRAAA